MKQIRFFRPVILRSSLDDMTAEQKQTAESLLRCRQVLAVTPAGPAPADCVRDSLPPGPFYYGSEAVGIYRKSLGLPDVSIRAVDVDGILTQSPAPDVCMDTLSLISRLSLQNTRVRNLSDAGAPFLIQQNEYRRLQELAEALQDSIRDGNLFLSAPGNRRRP